jgi:hypothetical protein
MTLVERFKFFSGKIGEKCPLFFTENVKTSPGVGGTGNNPARTIVE